jgi:hypothetical protein
MKKFLVTILAFTYLSVSTGATINMHYCMGKLMNWDLKQKQDAKCGSCGMEKMGHKGCCKDKQTVLKIEKDQKVSESGFQFLKYNQDAITNAYPALPVIHLSSIITGNPIAHAPPLVGSVPIFILHCNFRI